MPRRMWRSAGCVRMVPPVEIASSSSRNVPFKDTITAGLRRELRHAAADLGELITDGRGVAHDDDRELIRRQVVAYDRLRLGWCDGEELLDLLTRRAAA